MLLNASKSMQEATDKHVSGLIFSRDFYREESREYFQKYWSAILVKPDTEENQHTGQEYKRRPIPYKMRQEIYARDYHACLKCGATEEITIDHIIPVAKGGSNDRDNLQTLCRSCNSHKRTRVEDYRIMDVAA